MRDRDQASGGRRVWPRPLEDDAVDVGGIDRRSYGKLADMAKVLPWASTTAEPMRAETLVL